MFYKNILELSGQTPLVEIPDPSLKSGVRILAKMECFNPGGSIKDRVAAAMLQAAEDSGELTPGKTVIEATSGNTGIGLAMACAVKGYRLKLLMPETASEERKRIMRGYGAEISLTEGRLGTDGAIELAYRMAREEPDKYVLMDQFNNPASIDAHYQGTGQEIWDQTDGAVTHVVAALGTSGTVMGIVKRLKELNPSAEVAAVEPYAHHKIQGLKNMQESYPPGIFNKHKLDRILRVEDDEAFETCRELARSYGLLMGMSSGAAFAGARKLARELDEGLIVVIFPDGGERYLSTPLFAPPEQIGVRVEGISGRDVVIPTGGDAVLATPGPSLDRSDDPEFWRRMMLLDVLGRYLTQEGADVALRAGLADLDDRTMAAARGERRARAEYSAEVRDGIAAMAHRFGVRNVSFPLASEVHDQCLEACESLLAKGMAYDKLRSVYFDVARDSEYGRLCRTDLANLSLGKTVDLADYVKANPQDFTLLKRASLQDLKEGECWQTRWGNVRPSWFLQMACTVAADERGPSVFLGGETHIFPHMENLRALWAGTNVHTPGAWMMSRGVADCGDVRPSIDALFDMGLSAGAIRMWLLSVSYGKGLDLSLRTLEMWRRNQHTVQELAASLAVVEGEAGSTLLDGEADLLLAGIRQSLRRSVENNLRIYSFWPDLFAFCRNVRKLRDTGRLSDTDAVACRERLMHVDHVLGVLDHDALPLPKGKWGVGVAGLLRQRDQARLSGDYDRADSIRQELLQDGWRIEDAPDGVRVYKG